MSLLKSVQPVLSTLQNIVPQRSFHVSAALSRVNVGRYKPTRNKSFPLTYDMAMKPHDIASKKAWKSWNTSNLKDGKYVAETLISDAFIRSFLKGAWKGAIASEIIIKRQFNMIRISAFISPLLKPPRQYFLLGFSEEFLCRYFRCPVKLEFVSIADKEKLIYQYI